MTGLRWSRIKTVGRVVSDHLPFLQQNRVMLQNRRASADRSCAGLPLDIAGASRESSQLALSLPIAVG